jgi:hypothetical protein
MESARSSLQLSNAGDTLKTYLEKGISDAKRRHAQGDTRAKLQVTSAKSYQVTIDFDGDGIVETRTITLPGRISFVYNSASPPTATVDWRGNVAEGNVTFNLRSDRNQTLGIELTSAGDAIVNNGLPTLPTVSVTPTSSDVRPSSALVGNSSPNLDPSPTPTPTPLPYCAGNQLPATNNCRCRAGQTIDNKGKCN